MQDLGKHSRRSSIPGARGDHPRRLRRCVNVQPRCHLHAEPTHQVEETLADYDRAGAPGASRRISSAACLRTSLALRPRPRSTQKKERVRGCGVHASRMRSGRHRRGIVPGGGVALLRASKILKRLQDGHRAGADDRPVSDETVAVGRAAEEHYALDRPVRRATQAPSSSTR